MDTPALAHARLRTGFAEGATRPLSFRLEQLRRLRAFLIETEADFLDATQRDLGKHPHEALLYDMGPVCVDLACMLDRLPALARGRTTRSTGAPVVLTPSPKGVVLILGPFNFPIHLILRPLTAALAAGNAVVLKPSELAPASAAYVQRLTAVLDPRAFAVVQGGVDTAKDLLARKWDHILFTGSPRVGRIVMAAAARHLTPVTLELGGKNPALVTASAHVDLAAEAVVRARFLNAGQACIAADYVLVDKAVHEQFLRAVLASVKQLFGEEPKKCAHYSRLISSQHWDRVTSLLSASKGTVHVGGEADDAAQHYLAPTVVTVDSADDSLMREEIFGPVLPILRVPSVDAALEIVNARPAPLALYVFADKKTARDVVSRTRSGSVGVNETLYQVGSYLGGFGESGMGAYGGARGFKEFSHMRPVMWSTPFYFKMCRPLRVDLVARRNWMRPVVRLFMAIPFPGGDRPLGRKIKTWSRRALKICVVAGIGSAVKALRQEPTSSG